MTVMTPAKIKENGQESDQGNMIKHIDQDTVRFIAAGEKINDIETVIRELIDNAIDAGARNIEIRLQKFGVDCIEVDDNGSGISEENFVHLGRRYHTSKVSDFSKLQDSLETFGFRGEALSCLCTIAQLSISTKAKSSPTGTRLTFNKDGSIAKTEPVARDTGTTVIVKNLFYSLPVRRRELGMTAKRQYDKVVKLIYEHILARPHIKFSLVRKLGKKKDKDFAYGGTTLEGVIMSIFSVKVMDSLMPIRQFGAGSTHDLPVEISDSIKTSDSAVANKRTTRSSIRRDSSFSEDSQVDEKPAVKIENIEPTAKSAKSDFFRRSCKSKFAREKPGFSIHGYISKVSCGRNSTDCQFIFVNKKPCDIPKISRAINEIYRIYTPSQYPFYCLFIQVQNWAADFNVPRKRAVIVQEEEKLCNIIRESLDAMFLPSAPGSQKSCSMAEIPLTMSKTSNRSEETPVSRPTQLLDSGKRAASENGEMTFDKIEVLPPSKKILLNNGTASPTKFPMDPEKAFEMVKGKDEEVTMNTVKQAAKETSFKTALDMIQDSGPESTSKPLEEAAIEVGPGTSTDRVDGEAPETIQRLPVGANQNNVSEDLKVTVEEIVYEPSSTTYLQEELVTVNDDAREVTSEIFHVGEEPTTSQLMALVVANPFRQVKTIGGDEVSVAIENLDDLETALRRERYQRMNHSDSKEFTFAIHPQFNTMAEQQLRLNLNKTSFKNMRVLGQFNKGFIIASLNGHIFIIDQHATDERANYEDQLEKSPLVKQPMVYPKPLFLNLIQENAVLDNLKAFQDRGFDFKVDTTKQIGYRVMLTSTSICKGHGLDEHLTKEDVEELIDVILESPSRLSTYSLKKVKSVAATRACRKSVMIGDKLTWPKMVGIVSRMADLKNPWICAHGRPTIRHLMEVDWTGK